MSYFLFDKSLFPFGCEAVVNWFWDSYAVKREQAPSPQ